MGAGHSALNAASSTPFPSPRRRRGEAPAAAPSAAIAMVNRVPPPPAAIVEDVVLPAAEELAKSAAEDEEQQEFSVSFGYHCRGYLHASDGVLICTESKFASVRESSTPTQTPFAFSSSPATASPGLSSMLAQQGPATPSSSPPTVDIRRRSSSFSFLAGAALGANATLANSFLVSSSCSRTHLLDMDSPKAFRHMRCPVRGNPAAGGVPQWIGLEARGSEPQQPSQQHPHSQRHQVPPPLQQQTFLQQQQQGRFIGIGPPNAHQLSSAPGPSWMSSGSTVGSVSSTSSAGSSGNSNNNINNMSNSAPDLMGSSFLLASDVQFAGGAAGEDRVQAVCSEENGWLFCGVYDGFNGRDAADFLAANLYENIGMHLRLLQWRSQVGEETAVSRDPPLLHQQHHQGVQAIEAPQTEGHVSPDALPQQRQPTGGVSASVGCSKPHAKTEPPAASPISGPPGLDLSFLQPWVLCSCGSSLCECPLHQGTARISSPPLLPTVNEDDGPAHSTPHSSRQEVYGGVGTPAAGTSSGPARERKIEASLRGEVSELSQGRGRSSSGASTGSQTAPVCAGSAESASRKGEPSLPHQKQQPGGFDPFQQTVAAGLRRALGHTERDFFKMVEQEVDDRPDLTMVGSCVLALLIHGQHLFTMNLGDSRAVLATWDTLSGGGGSHAPSSTSVKGVSISSCASAGIAGSECPRGVSGAVDIEKKGRSLFDAGRKMLLPESPLVATSSEKMRPRSPYQQGLEGLQAVQLTETHCVDFEPERERIIREHLDDPSAIIGRRVKGKLRVTRAFGAGYLKSEKMNNSLMGIFRVKDLWSPPYVSSEPYLTAHRLSPLDHFVVIGSDGLFDFFSNEEVVDLVASFLAVNPHGDPAKYMLEQLLLRAADRAGKTLDELRSIPRGKRRKYHDDTTVIVITLGHTFRTSSASTLL